MKLSSETQGSFNCADHDIKIRVRTRTITPGLATFRSRLPLTTSSTPFVETSGNAEWNYNGSSWVVTVQKDIPFVASNGTVAGFDRVHSNNAKENKNNHSWGEDLVEHVAEHVVEEHLVRKCGAENRVAEHVAGEIAAETLMPGLGLLFGLPM